MIAIVIPMPDRPAPPTRALALSVISEDIVRLLVRAADVLAPMDHPSTLGDFPPHVQLQYRQLAQGLIAGLSHLHVVRATALTIDHAIAALDAEQGPLGLRDERLIREAVKIAISEYLPELVKQGSPDLRTPKGAA